MRTELQTSELKKLCPFQPQLNQVTIGLSFQEFLKSQEQHKEKKEQSLFFRKKLKDKSEIACLKDKPEISINSKTIMKSKPSSAIKSALFDQRDISQQGIETKKRLQYQSQNQSILQKKPSIANNLWNNKTQDYRCLSSRTSVNPRTNNKKQENKPVKKAKDKEYVINKYKKTFEKAYQEIIEDESNENLNYSAFIKLLHKLGCISKGSNNNSSQELWEFLGGAKNGIIEKKKLMFTLGAILLVPGITQKQVLYKFNYMI